METRGFRIHRDKGGTAKGRYHLAKGLGASYVAIHSGLAIVWKSARLTLLCRDSSAADLSFFLAQLLEPGGYFLQCFGESFVEVRVGRLGGSAERIAGALASGSRRVADVVRGNLHESSYVKGMA